MNNTKQKFCKATGCLNKSRRHELCGAHSYRFKRYGNYELPERIKQRCSVSGCERPYHARGLCDMHRGRLKYKGDVGGPAPLVGARGTGHTDKITGYRYFHQPSHPNAGKHGKVAEHTIVMSEMLGRPLKKGESVHHKNGIRSDNNPKNLQLWTKAQPPGQSVLDMLEFCRAYLKEYEAYESLISIPKEEVE